MKKIVLNIIHAGFSGSAEWFEGLITLIVSKYNSRSMILWPKKGQDKYVLWVNCIQLKK